MKGEKDEPHGMDKFEKNMDDIAGGEVYKIFRDQSRTGSRNITIGSKD